jgi:uncharacterized protein
MSKIVWAHDDLDGQCSAAIVGGQCYPVDYKDPLPLHSLHSGDDLWIVDFSLKPEEWEPICTVAGSVTWIDHHISAINKCKGTIAEKLPGIREEGKKSACMLTWEYLSSSEAPYAVKLISDYDSWTLEYPETKRFKRGLEMLWDTRPESDSWVTLLGNTPPEFYEGLIRNGGKIMMKDSISNKKQLEHLGFRARLEEFCVVACNVMYKGSDFFDSVKNQSFDLFMPLYFDGTQYTVSIYRGDSNYDCAEIASRFGGGGHPGAAGFQCKELPFTYIYKL